MKLDFATILTLLVLASGAIWAYDSIVLARRRKSATEQARQEDGRELALQPSKLVEYARSFFPIFLIVLLLRSFLVEPFRIPSGSMMPTLVIGDFILVNKFTYGIRLPVVDKKIIELGEPQRGDVMVFRFPEDPSVPFIKRVVGLPGDRVAYYKKVLYINGEPMEQAARGVYTGIGSGMTMTGAQVFEEALAEQKHEILVQPGHPTLEGESVVPEGHYFVMGDNRDNSRDSRFWGTVPDENLIGKAFLIWMNWDWAAGGIGWDRIGRSIE
ncbi:MAG: signal peptidase I [Gammaproteobacteria bacterium]|nr:signal peptidase I [Gammaproteobacteria bacterium]MDJ0871316.1 signal peptidase I [Gammaproteobacteria bacterium]